MFDSSMLMYTVIGLVPNLLVILFAIAKMHRDVRVLASKVETIEREMQLVDDAVKQVGNDLKTQGTLPPPSSAQPKVAG